MQIGESFEWWVGVVEDRDDPLKLGRVRVRIFSHHDEDKIEMPTNTLPWAQPMQPIGSAAVGDVGYSPTGIVEGTWVVGFWLDGTEGQRPVIMGTLAGIPIKNAETSKGFNDPNGVYPKRTNEPDVNRLARNDDEYKHPVLQTKEDNRSNDIPRALGYNDYDEPPSAYAAAYPKNHVYESESGHIREYDDTPTEERIHEFHKAGTFYEIDKDGNKVTRVVKNNYEIISGEDFCYVKGSCHLTIDANASTYIKGNWDIQVDKNLTIDVGGHIDVDSRKNITIDSGDTSSGDGKIFLNSSAAADEASSE
jgi:hypothetical protein